MTIHRVDEARGVPFLVMPLLRGESLESCLHRPPRLPLAEVVRIGREIAKGLAAAHAHGLIHRDIKPGNVWLDASAAGRVKILDFGLVATALDDQARLTASGCAVGTPAYMAPEQVFGTKVDHRADLYSLGVVLYQMITGTLPARGADTLLSPQDLNPTIPAALSRLIVQLLAGDPSQRPQSAGDVADRLETLDRQLALPDISTESLPRSSPATPRWGGRFLVAAGALVAMALLALVPSIQVLAGTVIRFVTNKGELVIQTDDPKLEVTIKNGVVLIHDKVKDRRFVLTAGDYDVTVREEGKDGLRFVTRRFTMTRGGKETFDARLELGKASSTKPEGEAPRINLAGKDFQVGSRVVVTTQTGGFVDNATDTLNDLVSVVPRGAKGKVIEFSPDGNRCLVRLDDPAGEEVWILVDKLEKVPD